MIKSIYIVFVLLLSSCSEGSTIWSQPVGSSVFGGLFGSNDEKEEKKVEKDRPLITYGALQNNLSEDLTARYTNPMHKIPIGSKLVDGFTENFPTVKLEPVITGRSKEIYDNLQGPFPPDISGIMPTGDGGDFPPALPDLPFADLNVSPMITHPFTSIEALPKAPATEFLFDEISKKPSFFD